MGFVEGGEILVGFENVFVDYVREYNVLFIEFAGYSLLLIGGCDGEGCFFEILVIEVGI